jgi:hypothetical protein
LFQAPHKGGQFASLKLADPTEVEQRFRDAARDRSDYASIAREELDGRVRDAFRQGLAEPYLDWYHLARKDWRVAKAA